MKKKRRTIIIWVSVFFSIVFIICLGITVFINQNLLEYGVVEFNYGKIDDAVYYEFISSDGIDVNLNTIVTKNQRDREGKIIKSKMYIWVGKQTNSSKVKTQNYFKEIMSNEQAIIEWVFIFKDKKITILNGEYSN